jgi:hypothetical protein
MHKKKLHIECKECESSNIKGYGYDEKTGTLAVEYKSGGLYHYPNVSADKHKELEKAKSKGSFLPGIIKGLKFEKIK